MRDGSEVQRDVELPQRFGGFLRGVVQEVAIGLVGR
jgi:hypothetical protein